MDIVDDGLYIKSVCASGNTGLFVWPDKEDMDTVPQEAIKPVLIIPLFENVGLYLPYTNMILTDHTDDLLSGSNIS